MKYLKNFNESSEITDPTIEKFISIVNKHFNDKDVKYLGKMSLYNHINDDVKGTYEEMKRRLGEYSEYIYPGIMGRRLEDLMEEVEEKMFSVNGYLFKVSDNLLSTEHNLDRFKEQLRYEDEDFIDSLKWEYGDRLLDGNETHKLYSTWDDSY